MASIRERVTGSGRKRYHVQIRKKGHPPVTASFDRRTDAKRWAIETEAAITDGRYFRNTEAKRRTFAEMIERFRRFQLPQMPKVAKTFSGQLDWWESQLGHYTLADISPSRITDCRDRLTTEGAGNGRLQPATVNRYLQCLSVVYSAAQEWEWVEQSPMRRVKKHKEPRGRVRYLSADGVNSRGETVEGERTRLLKACRESKNRGLYPAVLLSIATGIRKSECMGLKWCDVDLDNRTITLHETKTDERRTVPLVGQSLCALQEHAKVRYLDSPLVFPSRKNPARPVNLRDPWIRAMNRADIQNFRWHDLRHTTASYLAMSGASVAEIAAVLGHKTLQMVKRYTHLSEPHVTSVVQRMANKFLS